jgi:hypothetical protein
VANELKFGNKVIFAGGTPLTLPVATSDPGGAVAGDLYYNSTTNVVKYYNGSSWGPVGSGTVTSVALSDGSTTPIYNISGSPVTNSGTLTQTLAVQNANIVFAGPTTGGATQPSFRSLVAADIPALPYVTSVSLTVPTSILSVSGSPITSSGTLAISLATQSANQVFAGPASGGAVTPTFRSLVATDIPSLSGTYLALTGGTMSGNINMGSNKLTGLAAGTTTGDSVRYEQAVLITGVNDFTADQGMGGHKITNMANGTNPGDAVNFAQLSAAATGLTWLAPINDPDLLDDSLNTPPGSPVYSVTYIIGPSPTGAWANGGSGLSGHAVWWDGFEWIDISTGVTAVSGSGTAVQIGDRFGVAIANGHALTPAGGLTGKKDNIATVTGNTPGSFTYTFTVPAPNYAVSDLTAGSQHYGDSFTYSGVSNTWINFSGPSKVNAGNGLAYNGNTLNVLFDNVTIDLVSNQLEVKSGGISNTQINASAAISYSKLALTGSIVNADINASAAIAYSKLALTNSIVNADIATGAAIAFSKLAALSSANILVGNGSNVAASVPVSGDLTATNAGAFTVAKIQGTTVSGTTGTTNVVFSASPTLTGIINAADLTLSGTLTTGNVTSTTSLLLKANSGSSPINVQSSTFARSTDNVNFVSETYVNSTTLTNNSGPIAVVAFQFAVTSFAGEEISYVIESADASADCRIGTIRVTANSTGTIVPSISDMYSESADCGVTWTATNTAGVISVKYTTTNQAGDRTMRADVKQFIR